MLDLAEKLTKRFAEAEARRTAKVTAAEKEWAESEMAARRADVEATKALIASREAARAKRDTAIAEATQVFNDETVATSAEFSGQTAVRLEAFKKVVTQGEQLLNGDMAPPKTSAPTVRSEPEPPAAEEPAPEAARFDLAGNLMKPNRAPTLEDQPSNDAAA
jgi:hypothetical protein